MKKKSLLWSIAVLVLMTTGFCGYQLAGTGQAGIREVQTKEALLALTFDDGPDAAATPHLLSVLKKHNVKATFFVLGKQVEAFPGQLANIAQEGHEIGSHGYSHKWLNRMEGAELADEIARTEAAIGAVTAKPVLFRPPGGNTNQLVFDELARRNYRVIMWSVDPRDWQRKDAAGIARDVVKQARSGRIVLLHDGTYAPATPAAVDSLITQLAAAGYRFVTVSELLQAAEK